MAWVYLVHGTHLAVDAEDGDAAYAMEKQVTQEAEFQALEAKANALSLVISSKVDDEDEPSLSFFVGRDLWPDRHIHKGQTVSTEIGQGLPAGVAELTEGIKSILASHGLTVKKATSGIVLNQFD